METFRLLLRSAALVGVVLTCSAGAHAETTQGLPAGRYTLDPRHTSVIFKVSHLGFSYFTGRFDHLEGHYTADTNEPQKTLLDVSIYPDSVDTNDAELDDTLRSENWFNTLKFPRATFHATSLKQTGDTTAQITGDFTLLGIAHNVVLDASLVGEGTDPLNGREVIGVTASGSFDRSSFGLNNLEPFVGDKIILEINTEFDRDN